MTDGDSKFYCKRCGRDVEQRETAGDVEWIVPTQAMPIACRPMMEGETRRGHGPIFSRKWSAQEVMDATHGHGGYVEDSR